MSLLKSHEIVALEYLKCTPDRIKTIVDENTLAAALLYCQLSDRGLVEIDNDDGMLVTITLAGMFALTEGERP